VPGSPAGGGSKTRRNRWSSFSVQLYKGESKLFQSRASYPVAVSRLVVLLWLIAPTLLATTLAAAPPQQAGPDRSRQLQRILDRVKERLGIDHPVSVELVAKNPYLISVEAPTRLGDAFLVRVEVRILELLGSDELEAALAHELGHVWVFTHFPYLQTEQLANEVALRVVGRETLAGVYEKVWKSGATKGNLATFLGPEPVVAGGGGRGQQ